MTIKDLKPFGKGWQWKMVNDAKKDIEYHTGSDGRGLWRDGKKVIENKYFELPRDKEKARSKLRRLYKQDFFTS